MKERVDALDGLRGVAALVVVVHHCLLVGPSFYDSYAAEPGRQPATVAVLAYTPLHLLWAGPEAVWIFFALSGFVLVRPYLSGRAFDAREYYPRRLLRLYVPLAGAVVFAAMLRLVVHRRVSGGSIWLNGHAAPSSLHDALWSLAALRGSFGPLNTVWWTLQWEIWFSLLLPLFIWVALRSRRHAYLLVGAAVALSAFGPPLCRALHVDSRQVIGAVSFLPIFVIGVGLAILEPALRGPTSKLRVAPGLLCLVSLVLIISYWPAEWVALHGMGHVSRVGPVTRVFGLVGVALLIALALVNPVLSRGLSRPGMRWLGSRSFSLYLVHEPIIVTLAFVWRLASVPAWFVVVGVTCSLVAAEGFFRAVERPTLLLLRRIRQPRLQTGGSRAPDSVA